MRRAKKRARAKWPRGNRAVASFRRAFASSYPVCTQPGPPERRALEEPPLDREEGAKLRPDATPGGSGKTALESHADANRAFPSLVRRHGHRCRRQVPRRPVPARLGPFAGRSHAGPASAPRSARLLPFEVVLVGMGVFFTTRERSAPAGLPLVREILKDAIPAHTTARTTDARIPRASLASFIGTEYYPRRPACAIRLGDRFPARRHTPRSPEGLEQPGVLGAGRRRGKKRPAGPGARSDPRAESPEGRPSHLSHRPVEQALLAATTAPGAAVVAAQWSQPPPARSARKAAAARTGSRATRQAKERGFRAETARGRPCLRQSGHRRNPFP
jgi:hypothetical protein